MKSNGTTPVILHFYRNWAEFSEEAVGRVCGQRDHPLGEGVVESLGEQGGV